MWSLLHFRWGNLTHVTSPAWDPPSSCKGLFTWKCGTPGRWGNPLRRGKKIIVLYMQSYSPPSRGALPRYYWMVAKHVNKKYAGKPRVLAKMLLNTPLLLLLQPSVLWLSIVSFNNDAKPPPKWILREFDVSRIGPRLGGLPHLERLHGKIWPRLRG